VDRIIFCVFLEVDYKIFKKKMGEFFPLDDANEEGTELSEETGGSGQKGQPPSPTKSEAEQPEDLQDDAEGGNGTEKKNTEETEAQSREADETKPSAVASLSSSEETELSEDKYSLKDSKGARESDPAHPVGCEQDQAEGRQDVSAEEEMKTGADSQSSCMEIEEPLLNQEDTTEVEVPLIHGAEDKEEGKEGGGLHFEKTSVEPMKADLACEAADVSNKDGELTASQLKAQAYITSFPKAASSLPNTIGEKKKMKAVSDLKFHTFFYKLVRADERAIGIPTFGSCAVARRYLTFKHVASLQGESGMPCCRRTSTGSAAAASALTDANHVLGYFFSSCEELAFAGKSFPGRNSRAAKQLAD
ncbi:PREDICTED: O-acetyl-ADP-ribose deacetylase MACROD2, partial [Phaethon lepturus]|uniref:O-acetyl-ADP-ribose deacetylase MACROD2 n=1 Tax=Phaethon lepturus TaxID=97097 RepID=UPI00053082A2